MMNHREDWTGAISAADAPREPGLPHSLYLVLTLVPEGLCGQVIDGQGPIQVANSCQRHPGRREHHEGSWGDLHLDPLSSLVPSPLPQAPCSCVQAEAALTLTHCRSPRTPRSWTHSPPLLPGSAGRPQSRV